MDTQNYYELLGISKDATSKEITAAYRKLALNYHPDRNKNPFASETMTIINSAYETLSDPLKRMEYDKRILLEKTIKHYYSNPQNKKLVSTIEEMIEILINKSNQLLNRCLILFKYVIRYAKI